MNAKSPLARTSISDVDDMFLRSIESALSNDAAFATFKRMPGIKATIERVKPARAAMYRDTVLRQSPHLLDQFSTFQAGDRIGGADVVSYPEGPLSPTTWRYIKVLSDLQTLFGSLDGFHVAEIGVGYGGQCKVINDVHDVASYTLFDLEPVSRLATRYLEAAGSPVVSKLRLGDFRILGQGPSPAFDIVISSWALSECDKQIQDRYIAHVLRRSTRGYINYNQISRLFGVDSYTMAEFVGALEFPVRWTHDDVSHPALPESSQLFLVDWLREPVPVHEATR
jgi:putative sugar O-methyltransferase